MIELSERAGLTLDPWQRDALHLMLAVRSDDRWACFEYVEMVARQNGKTAGLLAPRALAGLFLFGERLIMWSAHEYKTAMESFLFMRGLVERLVSTGQVEPLKVINTNGEEGFELATGQRLKFIARSKGSGRGFSGDLNLIDEAFAYTPSQQAALMPTMSARPNPQIVYTSSPPLDSESGIPLFGLKARAEAGGDGSLGFRDFGAPGTLAQVEDGEVDLDDRDMWAASNPALGLRITEETIERNRRSLTTVDFAREIGGIWPEAPEEGGRVLKAEDWSARKAPAGSQIHGDVVFGIDVNPERTRAAIGVCGVNDVGDKQIEVVDQDRGLGWVVERATALNRTWEPLVWVVDPLSPAGPLIPELENAGLPVHQLTTRQLVAGSGGFYDAVKEGGVAHLDCPVLDPAVAAARKRDVGDGGWAFGRKNSDANIAPLVATVLAYWGVCEFGGDATGDVW